MASDSRVFEAQFPGACAGCPNGIDTGEDVRYVDDQLVHVGCKPPPDPTKVQRPLCPRCFMELPIAGECGTCG